MQTIRFKEGPGYSLQGDLYSATGASMGTIIYLHGGALIWGSRKGLPAWEADLFTREGFDVAALDYRLAPETKLAGIVQDVRDGLDWVRHQGARYGLNTENLFVVGSSAGGYLSLLSGTFPHRPAAIVSFYGYGDILADWYTQPSGYYLQKPLIGRDEAYRAVGVQPVSEGPRERFLYYLYCRQQGVWPTEVEATPEYCPLHQADEGFPPSLLLHGDRDTDVPYDQSVQMNNRLQALGVPSRLITLTGKEHVFDHAQDDLAVQQALATVVGFLKEQCGGAAS